MDGVLLFEHVRVSRNIFFAHRADCYSRLNIALELAKHNDIYEDIASKFFEVCHDCFNHLGQSNLRICSTSSSFPMP